MGILADNELTPKQQLFVDAYLSNGFNGVDAARKAGYKGEYKTLAVVANENLNKPYLKAVIERRTQPLVKQREQRIVDVYQEYRENLEFLRPLQKAFQQAIDTTDGVNIADKGQIELALKIIDRIDATLDKFAKMGGEYTQDKKNPADNKTIIEETIRELMAENIPEEQIREVLAERYPETVH